VSSGPLNLKVAGRIAGVRDIPFEDLTQARPRPGIAAVTGLLSLTSLTLYLFFLGITDFRSVTKIGPRVKIPTTLVVVMSGVYFGSKTATELGLTSYYAVGNMAFFVRNCMGICHILNPKQSRFEFQYLSKKGTDLFSVWCRHHTKQSPRRNTRALLFPGFGKAVLVTRALPTINVQDFTRDKVGAVPDTRPPAQCR